MNNTYEEIAKFSKQLMLKEPFYGLVLISLNKELDKKLNFENCFNFHGWYR